MKPLYMFLLLAVVFWAAWWFFRRGRVADRTGECRVLRRIERDDGVIVEIVDEACQEGLPHTTDKNIVRITESKWKSDRKDEIMRHEYVHLWQKSDPVAWAQFYYKAWGYELLPRPPPDIPTDLIRRLRPNPDTLAAPWALWRGKYLFFPVYRDDEKRLTDAKVIVWNMDTRGVEPAPDAWRQFFCDADRCPSQYEHPHEISAEYHTLGMKTPAAALLEKFIGNVRK